MAKTRTAPWLVAAALAGHSVAWGGEPLPMAFNERPPFHFLAKDGVTPRGLVADVVVRALQDAGIDASYVSMESRRILAETQGPRPFCSFSWFQTEERTKFAKFTRPIWQDKPFVIVGRKQDETLLRSHRTLADLFDDPALSFGTRKGTAYNPVVDELKRRARTIVVEPANTQTAMVKMLAANRFHFMILVPDEIDALFEGAGVDPKQFAVLSYRDMPPGGKRRIMCSKAVPDATMERIDAALARHVPPGLRE